MSINRDLFLFLGILTAILGIFICCGCNTSASVDTSGNGDDDTSSNDDDSANDDDSGSDDDTNAPDTTPPDPPYVEPPVSPTTLDYQSIRGHSEPEAKIHITGGLADATTMADGNGDFCVKVALKINDTNTLEVTAEDAAGNESDPTTAIIEQQTENYALDGYASASSISHSKPESTPDKAKDNNYLTWWENTTQPWYEEAKYNPQWLGIQMTNLYWITKLDIYWGRDNVGKYEYATNFDVCINTLENPTKLPHEIPVENYPDYGYIIITNIQQPAGESITQNTVDLSTNPVQARWVFLLLHTSNQPGLAGTYSYEVAELEIYGYENPDSGCE